MAAIGNGYRVHATVRSRPYADRYLEPTTLGNLAGGTSLRVAMTDLLRSRAGRVCAPEHDLGGGRGPAARAAREEPRVEAPTKRAWG